MAQVSFAEFPETRQRYIPHPVCKAIGSQRASVSRRCYHNKPAFTGTITAPGRLKGGRLGRNLGGICIFFSPQTVKVLSKAMTVVPEDFVGRGTRVSAVTRHLPFFLIWDRAI